MTRRDLEETILNLEYLVALKSSDVTKREEYEQQLQTFRVVLQAANQQQDSLTAARKRNLDSYRKVALLYAEEELFLTARALISREHLSVGHQHLRKLLEHEPSLPAEIGKCLRSLDATYSRREDTGATDAAGADALTTATMAVLAAVRDELGERVATLHS